MKAIVFLALSTTAFAATEAILPEPFAKARYEQTRSNSPFALATPVAATVVAPEIKFTENMYITGLGRADGLEYATIVRLGEENQPIRLVGKAPNSDGIALQEIVWSDAFGKSKVKLIKAGVTEEIGFSEKTVKPKMPNPPKNVPGTPRVRVIK